MKLEIKTEKKAGNFTLCTEYEGEAGVLGILGASGCGKSMTLRMIAGIETPDSGYIRIGDRTLYDSSRHINIRPQERGVGYLFQNYALFPHMTVRENIAFALKGSAAEKDRTVKEMIASYRLEGLEDNLPHQLSGGQQQRAALARMMALRPGVVLLDEPFSALDVYLRDQMIMEMGAFLDSYEGLAILVSHSRDEIYRLCKEVAVMDEGRIIRRGKNREVFDDPKLIRAAVLTGCKNILKARRLDDNSILLPEWNTVLHTEGRVPDEMSAVGIRAHFLEPVWVPDGEGGKTGEMDENRDNLLRIETESVSQMPFERLFYLKPAPGISSDQGTVLKWFVQMDMVRILEKRGMPSYLRIPEPALMYLS